MWWFRRSAEVSEQLELLTRHPTAPIFQQNGRRKNFDRTVVNYGGQMGQQFYGDSRDKEAMMTTAQKTAPSSVDLNPGLKSPAAQEFEDKLTALIVGQDRAVRRITGLYQIFLAGLAHPGRPIGTLLFLGPTGSGKTRVVEAASE